MFGLIRVSRACRILKIRAANSARSADIPPSVAGKTTLSDQHAFARLPVSLEMLVVPSPANPDLHSRTLCIKEAASRSADASAFSFDLYAALLCLRKASAGSVRPLRISAG